MKDYTVYFEFFGRKMRHTLPAYSQADARKKITEMIKFHAVKAKPKDPFSDLFDKLFH
jgi:hypothetical protein